MAKSAASACRHHSPRLFHSRTALKIGLLGGSFNPAHDGHIHISLQAHRQLGLDQIWWLVSPQNPLKSPKDMADLNKRLADARAKAAPYRLLKVIAPEVNLPSNFTYNTIKHLKKTMPSARLIWIMGADNTAQLPQWRRYRDLLSLLPIAVIDRPSYSYQAISAGLHLFRRRYTSKKMRHKLACRQLQLPAWCFINGQRHHASATAIRQRHQTGIVQQKPH